MENGQCFGGQVRRMAGQSLRREVHSLNHLQSRTGWLTVAAWKVNWANLLAKMPEKAGGLGRADD